MEFIFLPPILIFVFSFFRINKITMSIIASSILLPVLYIFFHHFVNNYFYVDNLNAFILLISSVVAVGISIFMISISKRVGLTQKQTKRFYRFFGIFLIGILIAILSNNMGLYWIGLEFATLSTVYMIKVSNTHNANTEAWKYLVVGAIAISLILFGIILMYSAAKPILGEEAMNFFALNKSAKLLNGFLFEIGFAVAITGMFIKMGFFPMNLWLADIERASIYSVGALFSGILESAIILGFFRLSLVEMQINYPHLITFVYVYGLITLFMVSFLIYRAKDYVRLFALSGIEHMSLIVLFWVSGGYFAALLHFASHAFLKPALFLSSSMLESNKKYYFKGTLKSLKFGGFLIGLLMLGIISLPPSPMFFSEIYGFKAMIDVSRDSSHFYLMIFGVFLVLMFLSVVFYKFVQVYQDGLSEEGCQNKTYKTEILGLFIFIFALIALLLPQSLEFMQGIIK
jgi:hydrogenase-4 component F